MNPVITESVRDAIQGLPGYIPAHIKTEYINLLLKVGFDIIDIGSFVSEKAIPQLKDTAEVLRKLDISDTRSKIMVVVANAKGIETALYFEEISWLAFPFSVSPTFLKLNINADSQQALRLIDLANNRCENLKRNFKVYLTMAFGNPYQDQFNTDIVMESVAKLHSIGISYITLSDITGVSNAVLIDQIYTQIIADYPSIEFGLHLHTTLYTYYEKLDAAFSGGCRSFDAVINGMGGCPMTGYELVSNLNTLDLIKYFNKHNIKTNINKNALNKAFKKNRELFSESSKINMLN